ncbi:Zinc finger RING-CH-type domain containing protein [Klebsormidium nitens]|uniref:Zinc finger RING-CH-type domain containing protein n=1 Tax=Klebsormidium nitens TaxID=105231 RepID=A0A1Y1IKK6_KLENI|nr:Zinc finger RING-CH-type domain containing protein [Klebsormidium nitens]|eukprot:GAQ89939.1 Zinc finger RING-CH-type domain containing protein [Klebsormidium nitens]
MGGANGDIAVATEKAPASTTMEDGITTVDMRTHSEAETSERGSESRKGKQAVPEGEAEMGLEAPLLRTDIEAGGGGQEGTEGEIPPGLRSLSKGSARSSSESVDECRICKEEREPGEKMIRPCLCGGSMARVHAHCLQAWLKRRRADVSQEDAFKCEVCKAPYRLHIREYFNCTAAALCSWTTCGFCTEFAVIAAALITLAGVFCLSILNDEADVGSLGFFITVGMDSFVFCLGIVMLKNVAQRWRAENTIPVLTPFSNVTSPTSPRSPRTSNV